MIGNRKVTTIIRAFFQRQHYVALLNMSKLYPRFLENLWRYLTARGEYPYDITVRTPVGLVSMRLYSHHDLLTVNEIFCRQDYSAESSLQHVVDIGSNIGISAIYFLTRNNHSTCVLYEPDPKNIPKLDHNLRAFRGRYTIIQAAVSDEAGHLEFGIEPTGRYGGLGRKTGKSIVVRCIHINEVIEEVLKSFSHIDILKIDTEGVEIQTVKAIRPKLLKSISKIYLEAQPLEYIHHKLFDNKQYGSVCQLKRLAQEATSSDTSSSSYG